MVIFKFDLSHKKTKQGIVLHLPHFKKPKTWISRGKRGSSIWNENGVGFRERRSSFSLKIWVSDRRRSSGREGKTFYAEQATRGLRICEFLINSKR